MDDSDDSNILPFAEREAGRGGSFAAPPPDGEPAEAVAPGDAFACVTGQRQAVALEFIRLSGESFTVPYSYRPLLWWHAPDRLILEYPGLFSVVLKGKGMTGLHGRVRDLKVTRVRELTPAQAAGLVVAVLSIEIVRVYPSRDGEPA